MKIKIVLVSLLATLVLWCVGGEPCVASPIKKTTEQGYVYQADNAVIYGSATRTVATQPVSNAVCRPTAGDAKKSLHRFISYFNTLTPTPDVMIGMQGVCPRTVCLAEQGVRLAFLRTMRI